MAHILVIHPKKGFRELVHRVLHDQHKLESVERYQDASGDHPLSGPYDAILCGWDKTHTIRIFEKALEQWSNVRLVPVFSTLDQVAEFATMWNVDPKRKDKYHDVGKERLRESFAPGDLMALFPSSFQIPIQDIAVKAAENDRPVLIVGEAGTGKRTLAEQIHQRSQRGKAGGPFKVFNCEGITDEADRLFGRVEIDTSGGIRGARSLLEEADGGTLVLAGVERTSKAMQIRVLSLLEDATMSYLRIAGRIPASADVRIMATASGSLRPLLGDFFSADLFYLLAANYIEVHRLRHRQAELLKLAREFLIQARAATTTNADATAEAPAKDPEAAELVTSNAETVLRTYSWPGNLRELKFAMRHAALRCAGRIDTNHLPAYIVNAAARTADESPA